MPPVASPGWNPIAPIQRNWDKIEPWHKGYMAIIGALGTIFTFGSAIALIVEHKGKLPKWPFTAERWNPKPTVDSNKTEEVSDEQIAEDELAEVVGVLGKRHLRSNNFAWFDEEALSQEVMNLIKRESTSL
jgi:hypothetical protein